MIPCRLVESSQTVIRVVGLSATLPNYIDVAKFLRVNPYVGLFFFDGRFRPVPLAQTFIGIKQANQVKSGHIYVWPPRIRILKRIRIQGVKSCLKIKRNLKIFSS